MALSINQLMQQFSWTIPNRNNYNNMDTNAYINSNIEQYLDQPWIANQFKALGSLKSWLLNDSRNNIINAYNIFEESTNPAFRQYLETNLNEWKKMLFDIDKQKQGVESWYWPGWEAEWLINEYITKYWDRITQQAQTNQALAKNTWVRTWASNAAVRAGVAQQQALDADNIIKFQEKKVWDLTNLYSTYNSLISWLRAEAGWVNQQFIIQPLAQALDRQSQIAQALVQNEASLNQMRMQMSQASSWSANAWLNQDLFMYDYLSKKKAKHLRKNWCFQIWWLKWWTNKVEKSIELDDCEIKLIYLVI